MPSNEFISALEAVIAERLRDMPESSYTARLAAAGPHRVAQKIGEEGVELALAAVSDEDSRVTAEAADLLYHVLVLLAMRGLTFADILAELERRHRPNHKR